MVVGLETRPYERAITMDGLCVGQEVFHLGIDVGAEVTAFDGLAGAIDDGAAANCHQAFAEGFHRAGDERQFSGGAVAADLAEEGARLAFFALNVA